jgi:lipid A 3-O-deacylase
MKRTSSPLLLFILLGLLLPAKGQAQASPENPTSALQVGVAYFDLVGSAGAAALELTYRHGSWRVWRMEPQVGAMFNADGGVYGYGGIALPLASSRGFGVTPSLSVGGYGQGGSLDLGQILEFRSGIELTLPGWDGDRIAVMVYHLSNASLGDRNPGTEVLGVGYLIRW